ncbi:hypothetical protein PVK06_043297 [Gossypium arboreum]|uniref:Uncharacterized protein n=1 Tax=Gossypium arboreum TaxID=29729 RepID=A0ABR0MN34_GOSAR|nr:hypothetical protein PVK06_043297 [Gossypium arboreum]
MRDSRCAWKIMAYVKKKTGLWMIKKFIDPHTSVATSTVSISICNPNMAELLNLTYSWGCRYFMGLSKVGFKGYVTDLETGLAYHNNCLLCGCRVFYRLFLDLQAILSSILLLSDQGTGILLAIERHGGLWDHTHHQYCLRHVASNYYQKYPSIAE